MSATPESEAVNESIFPAWQSWCTYTNSWTQRQQAQDLYKFKPDKILALKRGTEHKVPLLTKKLFAVITDAMIPGEPLGISKYASLHAPCSGIDGQ